MRQVALYEAVTAEQVWALVRGLAARTLVFDVEPLVAVWATDTAALDAGVGETLRLVAELNGVEAVLFATNSVRRPTALPGLAGLRVGYRSSARKPLRTRGYRELPSPGLVIGDQIATDGALAWRLGFDFVYFRPERDRIPLRPRVLDLVGSGLRPLIFRGGSLPGPFC